MGGPGQAGRMCEAGRAAPSGPTRLAAAVAPRPSHAPPTPGAVLLVLPPRQAAAEAPVDMVSALLLVQVLQVLPVPDSPFLPAGQRQRVIKARAGRALCRARKPLGLGVQDHFPGFPMRAPPRHGTNHAPVWGVSHPKGRRAERWRKSDGRSYKDEPHPMRCRNRILSTFNE